MVLEKGSQAANMALSSLVTNPDVTGDEWYPCLAGITGALASLLHFQKIMEQYWDPCIHLVLPMISNVKVQLQQKEAEMMNSRKITKQEGQKIVSVPLPILYWKLEVHYMWIYAAMLHPGLKMLSFISDNECLDSYRNRGSAQIRRLMRKLSSSEAEDAPVQVAITPS